MKYAGTKEYQEGLTAYSEGVKWWENPYPSGGILAYAWDQGHTKGRTGA